MTNEAAKKENLSFDEAIELIKQGQQVEINIPNCHMGISVPEFARKSNDWRTF